MFTLTVYLKVILVEKHQFYLLSICLFEIIAVALYTCMEISLL